ncbi:shikimate kinase [Anabaena sp. PCC 7108]|uniref:shikimate kinase n=1 Tax=Anabaena sp. PCC 7108 TaxID=163908 RepID=UPI0005A6245A|nr:shikimate kinase [Anabaena sp. PCC 7108]
MMGVGKTTVGRLLAQQIGYGFLDTDDVIIKAVGKSINEIFVDEGEAAFRQLESDILAQVCAYTQLIIATGGGIVLKRENWGYLHHGLIVWLDVPVEILMNRLREDQTRPLLQDSHPEDKLLLLLEQRQSLYSQADLHITITETETPEQVATRIFTAIKSIIKTENSQQQN